MFQMSGEMFRFASILGRCASQSRNAFRSIERSVLVPLRGCRLDGARNFCLQEIQTLNLKARDDHPSPSIPDGTKTNPRWTFSQELTESRSPSDVLDVVDRCNVAPWCISNSLTRMWHTTKKMSDEQRHWELRLMAEHPTFEKLCHGARMNAPRMQTQDLAFSLLALVKLGVSPSSYVVQTILRTVQERLKEFENEKALSVLAACLSEMDSSKNSDALKQGLKLVLEERIPAIQSVMLLHNTMRLFGKDASAPVKQKLERKALSMVDEFTLLNTQYLMETLAVIRLNSKPLLDICAKKLSENVHSISFTRMLLLLKSCSDLRYRNAHLFTSISEYLTSTFPMWSTKQVLLLLLEFTRLQFRPAALMDAFGERIVQKGDVLALRDVYGVLKCYSFLNHHLKENHQAFLDSVTHILESYLPKMSSADLLRAVSCLSVLGHFPRAPLERMLQDEVLHQLLNEEGAGRERHERLLRTLDLCLRLDRHDLRNSVSSVPHLRHSEAESRPANPVLLDSVNALLGTDAVAESVLEQGVYFIDCVVTLPPKSKEEQSVRIALLCLPPTSFCYGTSHPTGATALNIRHLKLLGYEPVLVPVQELVSQSADGRTDLLRKFLFPVDEK